MTDTSSSSQNAKGPDVPDGPQREGESKAPTSLPELLSEILPEKARFLSLAARGAVIGIAEAIPGVSGGTVALILGVYARLIDAIKSYTPKSVLAGLASITGLVKIEKRSALLGNSRALHFDFLIPLGVGMAPAFLIGTKVLPKLLTEHRAGMQAIFFGMILASVYVPWAMIGDKDGVKKGIQHFLLVGVGFAAAWLFIGFSKTVEPNLFFVFFFAAFAICALVLPGVSGSYLLHSVGLYTHISGALHENFDPVILVVFLLGAITGLVTSVRILSWLLQRFRASTLAVLTGLMIGSLRSVWFFQRPTGETRMHKGVAHPLYENIMPTSLDGDAWSVIALAGLGAAIVIALIVIDRRLGSPKPGSQEPGDAEPAA